MNTATIVDEALVEAAAALAQLLPSSVPLTPDSQSVGQSGIDTSGVTEAVVALFTGAQSYEVCVVVEDVVRQALAEMTGAPVEIQDAVRPALEAAVATLGAGVLDVASVVPLADVLAADDMHFVALSADGQTRAWFGMRERGAPAVANGRNGASRDATRPGRGPRSDRAGLHLLRDVEMTLTAELGRTSLTVRELLDLTPGSIVELDRPAGGPADLLVNGRLVARGEVVVLDEDYAVRILEIVRPAGEDED